MFSLLVQQKLVSLFYSLKNWTLTKAVLFNIIEVKTSKTLLLQCNYRILLLSADHLLERKNVQETIDLLSNIKPNDASFKEAKVKLAEILLKYRKDKYAYIECYKEFSKEVPQVESHVLVGDAYMKILGRYSFLFVNGLFVIIYEFSD